MNGDGDIQTQTVSALTTIAFDKIHLHGRKNQGRRQPAGLRLRAWRSPCPPRALNHGKISYGNRDYFFLILFFSFFTAIGSPLFWPAY
jgi:hypothetical protein